MNIFDHLEAQEKMMLAQKHKSSVYERCIAEQERYIAEKERQLAKQERLLAKQEHQLDQQELQLSKQKHEFAELELHFAKRGNHIVLIEGQLAERVKHIAEIERQLSEQNKQLASHLSTIEAFRNSISWRITVPIRFLSQVMTVIRLRGLYRLMRKALSILKARGWKGLRAQTRSELNAQKDNVHNVYQEWINRFETLSESGKKEIQKRISFFQKKPLISVIMPVYNPSIEFLAEAIDSVRNQSYKNWELCIADDASPNRAVSRLLKKLVAQDKRIKVTFRKENGHISKASNSALELATGEYVAFLDHDDTLPEHALFWIIEAINKKPESKIIYSDEDKIDLSGHRQHPYFKCDWNYDLFLSQNFISHTGVYHIDLIRDVKGFREGFEGSQDYDLALRCIERVTPDQIHHIPRILYHWRELPGSTALGSGEKPYALLAGHKAINEHFKRKKIAAKAEIIEPFYRVHYQIPKPYPPVTLIIPTRNGYTLLRNCIDSIMNKTRYPNYSIIIVDNGSDDPETLNYFRHIKCKQRIHILRDTRPFNYSALNNAAVKKVKKGIIGLMNNDIEVISKDWMEEMVSHAIRPEIGAVGARLWYPNDTLQHGGIITGIGGIAGHSHKVLMKGNTGYFSRAVLTQSLSAVTGACLFVRKALYDKVGGLNEKHLAIAFNDVDFCLKLQKLGYRNLWTPYAELYHHESASRGLEDTTEKQIRFKKECEYLEKMWKDILLKDPAYSPNLTLEKEDFSFAWPPRVESLPSM